MERLGVKQLIPNLTPTAAGQSPEHHPLRASMHAASQSPPPGLSTAAAVSVFFLGPATTSISALLQSCNYAAMPSCCPEHLGRAPSIESIATHCSNVCSEPANQALVRILATANLHFIHSTSRVVSQFCTDLWVSWM